MPNRPCNTDLFLVHIILHEPDHYNFRARIDNWIHGDWNEALSNLPPMNVYSDDTPIGRIK